MPKETFYNLDEEKRNNITEVLISEFSQKLLHIFVGSHAFSFVCMFLIGLYQFIGSVDLDVINLAVI